MSKNSLDETFIKEYQTTVSKKLHWEPKNNEMFVVSFVKYWKVPRWILQLATELFLYVSSKHF